MHNYVTGLQYTKEITGHEKGSWLTVYSAMRLFLWATAKASTTASTDNAIARSRSIANTAT